MVIGDGACLEERPIQCASSVKKGAVVPYDHPEAHRVGSQPPAAEVHNPATKYEFNDIIFFNHAFLGDFLRWTVRGTVVSLIGQKLKNE